MTVWLVLGGVLRFTTKVMSRSRFEKYNKAIVTSLVWHHWSWHHSKLSFTSGEAILYFHINSYSAISKHSQLWYKSFEGDGWWANWSLEMLSHLKPNPGNDERGLPNPKLSFHWIFNEDWQRPITQLHSSFIIVVPLNKFNDALMATPHVISFQQYPKYLYMIKNTTN